MATKPTKQQLAQSKTRAGGNNPIKVTSSGLKKLGTAAAIAASLTPVGRGIKAVGIAGKMAKTVDARRKFNAATEKRILDNQVKKSVKVLPRNTAAKRMGNPPAKTKPKPPNPSQIENRLGMANNRMIDRGVPVEARAAAGGSRRDAIAYSKLTGKPRKDTKPKLVPPKVNKNDRWQFEQWDD